MGIISPKQLTIYTIYIVISYVIGNYSLKQITQIQQLPNFLRTGIQIFLGATLNAVFFLLIGKYGFLLSLGFLLYILHKSNTKVFFNKSTLFEILILIPVFILLLTPEEFQLMTRLHYGMTWDYTFYTSIVESLKINQNFSNAIFQSGIPINYPAFAFGIPANIAFLSSIPSQITMWGIFMPFISFLSIQLTSCLIFKISCKIFNKKDTYNFPQLALINLMLVFWGPLHILNLIKGNFNESLFLGLGYLTPGGSPGYSISILLGSLVMLLFFFNEKNDIKNKILIIFLIIYIAGSKIAYILPLLTFLGTFSIIETYKEKSITKTTTIFIGGIFAIITIYFFAFSFESKTISFFSTDGFVIDELKTLANKYKIPSKSLFLLVSLALSIKLFYFLGLKLTIALSTINKHHQKIILYRIFTPLIITFLIFLPIYLFYNTAYLNLDGSLYRDGSFDTGQFMRSIIFLANLFFIAIALNFIEKKSKWRPIKICLISLWVMIGFYSFVWQNYRQSNASTTPDKKWYSEVLNDFKQIRPKQLIMLSDGYFSGLGLTSLGVHPWYIFGSIKMRDSYSNDIESLYRRKYLDDFFNTRLPLHSRKKAGEYFLKNHVDCIVENPFCKEKMNIALGDSLIQRINGTKHFYKITIH